MLSSLIAHNATAATLKNVLVNDFGLHPDTLVTESGVAEFGKKWRVSFNGNKGPQDLLLPVFNSDDLIGGKEETSP